MLTNFVLSQLQLIQYYLILHLPVLDKKKLYFSDNQSGIDRKITIYVQAFPYLFYK